MNAAPRRRTCISAALALCILLCLIAHTASSAPLKVRGDAGYPPYEFLEDGTPTGYNVDLFKAVARVMGLEYEMSLGPWSDVRAQLEAGRIDVLMGMFSSPERDRKVDFSTPHIIVSHSIFVRDNSEVKSEKDMIGREVIVQEGDIMHDYLLKKEGLVHVIPVPNQVVGLKMLSSGRYDMALLSKLQGVFTARSLGLKNLTTAGPPIMPREYCFAVPEGRTKLIAVLNEGLKIIHETGEYETIYNKWFGVTNKHMTKQDVMRYATLVAFPLLLLLILGSIWTRTLRRTVRARTRELEQSEQRFKSVVDRAHMPMALTTEDGTVVHINKAFTETLGYGLKDVPHVNEWWPQAYPDPELRKEAHDWWHEDLRSIREKGVPDAMRIWPVNCRDGSVKLIEFQYSPIGDLWLTTFHDMTEKKRLEEVMIRSEKMISVGGLAAGMAHEINNPLAGILQSAEILSIRLDPDSPKSRAAADEFGLDMQMLRNYLEHRNIPKLIENIQEAGERAAAIVEDMLAFSREEEEEPELADPAELLERSLELASKDFSLKKGFDFRKIKIIRNYDPATPRVMCRPGKMQQVFLNLLSNGAHAMAGLTDREPAFTLTVRPRAGRIEIRIEDNGEGMDQETRKRIFDPFFTTKPKGLGTGLGLSIAYFIIARRHGGELQLRSKPGKGTVFIIRLPAADNPA